MYIYSINSQNQNNEESSTFLIGSKNPKTKAKPFIFYFLSYVIYKVNKRTYQEHIIHV